VVRRGAQFWVKPQEAGRNSAFISGKGELEKMQESTAGSETKRPLGKKMRIFSEGRTGLIVVKEMTTCVFWALMKGADMATLFVSVRPADIGYTGTEKLRVDGPRFGPEGGLRIPSWRKLKPSRSVGFRMTPKRVIVWGPLDIVQVPDTTVRVIPVCCPCESSVFAPVTRAKPLTVMNCSGTPLKGKIEGVEVEMVRLWPVLRSTVDRKPMDTVWQVERSIGAWQEGPVSDVTWNPDKGPLGEPG